MSYQITQHALWQILAGVRNAVHYGIKIRFPHSLVMNLMFNKGSYSQIGKSIFRATYTHARNLGLFVFVFKTVRLLLRYIRQHDDGFNTALAGFVGGGLLFGNNDPINSQINMYIMSRVIFGIGRTMTKYNLVEYQPWMYTLFAAVIWGAVMYLYYHQGKVLQRSMESSMDFIYGDTDKSIVTNIWDLIVNGISFGVSK